MAFGLGTVAGGVAFGPLLYWLIPFGYAAFGLLTLVQALYVAGFVVLVARLGDVPGRGLWTAASWVTIEVIRGAWPLGGFSWGALAYTQAQGGLALGAARTVGTVGVSLLLASVAVAVEAAIRNALRSWELAKESDVPADAVFTAMRTPLLTILATLAVSVLLSGEAPDPTGSVASIGVVQGGDTRATSAAGVNRIDSDRIVRVAELMAQETLRFAEDTPDIVIWPENSLDSDVRTPNGESVAALLGDSLRVVSPSPILAGETARGPRSGTLYNRMTVFEQGDRGLEVGPSYAKQRPVPFAEFIPWRSYLEWVPPLEQIPNDVLAGEGPPGPAGPGRPPRTDHLLREHLPWCCPGAGPGRCGRAGGLDQQLIVRPDADVRPASCVQSGAGRGDRSLGRPRGHLRDLRLRLT